MDDQKRPLVERALAAAQRARPVLDLRAAVLTELVPVTDAALAAARSWLVDGDPQPAVDAGTAAASAIERAWIRFDQQVSATRDLLALKRAVHAAEAAALAARAAAWSPFDAPSGPDDGVASDRVVEGPIYQAVEAERCADLALGKIKGL